MNYGTLRAGASTRALLLAATTILACGAPQFALAQETPEPSPDAAATKGFGEIVVTAQKREESIQKVPISLQALGSATLENRQVQAFADYANLLPSVSFTSQGPGRSEVFFRGISSGSNGPGGSGLAPTAGLYLDELPVQTATRLLDVHIYDVARVEALSGPQGTLFGASSLSGTLRIITNKPDTKRFSAGFDGQVNKFGKGSTGGSLEGFVNLPLSPNVALRVVGYWVKDGGYIDNLPASLTYTRGTESTTDDLTINNSSIAHKDFNTTETYGGRLALGIELDNDWTITPSVVAQHQDAKGSFLYDLRLGDLQVKDFGPTRNVDDWVQGALTVKGHIGNFDLLYSGGYLDRKTVNDADYTYYTTYYDTHQNFFVPTIFVDPATGNYVDPTQKFHGANKYTKQTHEFRISSPRDGRLRVTAGLFFQRQTNHWQWNFNIPGGSNSVVPTDEGNVPGVDRFVVGDAFFYINSTQRQKDEAVFGEAAFDIAPHLTLTGGIRGFRNKETYGGFLGIWASAFYRGCALPLTDAAPCSYVDQASSESGETHKLNLSWQVDPEHLLYATYSTGFRPGGTNRRNGVNPYKSDKVSNYEIGFKTTWFGNLRVNGAAYYEKWNGMQFKLLSLGGSGISAIYNAAAARVYGVEGDVTWQRNGLTLSASGAYNDAKLARDVCNLDATLNILATCSTPQERQASKGTQLPGQPRFKGSATARYEFQAGKVDAFVQGVALHQSGSRSLIPDYENALIGNTPGFTTFDFSVGGKWNGSSFELFIENAFDKRGELSRNTFCAIAICADSARIYPIQPQRFGIKFGQRF